MLQNLEKLTKESSYVKQGEVNDWLKSLLV